MFELPHQSRHLPPGRSPKNQQIWRSDRETWTNRKHKTSPFCLSKIMLEANLAESCCPVVSHIFFAPKTQMPVNIDPAKQTFGEFKIFCNCCVFIWNSCEYLRVEPWEFQILKFRWFHDCRSQSWKSEEEMKTLPEGSNCGRAISMTCHQRFDRHHKVSQVAWQKAEFLEFLEFHKIWVLHQNEDDYTAGCHVLNKGTSNAATGKRFQCFSCVSACVISICLSALVFVLQKFGLKTSSCILP